ncbi:diguanylate cyclase [Massilia sp. CT11-108]|uniref:diguanylate cyclase n=1 Tax=Massilia sp. CT11-108 TaxID=3393900 RepID=UPI0039A75970
MRSARHLKFVALAVFIVMVLIAAVPFWLNRSVNVLLAQSRAELRAQQRLDDILTSMRDAETAQRGFVITGNDVFLEPYEQVRRTLPAALHDAKEKAGTDAERATAWRIARLAELKLAELDETIQLRRREGFEATERVVGSLRGKQYMDDLRRIVAAERTRRSARRDALQADLLARSARSFTVSVAATACNIIALGILLLVAMRMLRARRAIAGQLETQTGQLAEAVALTTRHNRELKFVAELLRAVEAVPSIPDAAPVIARSLPKLLPGVSGTLFLLRDEDDHVLDRHTQWGTPSGQPSEIDIESCWSLRHGARYRTASSNDLPCAHYRKPADETTARLCIPLVTHDELVGMLHLEGLAAGPDYEEQERLAVTVAEQLALALGNARLRESLRRQSVLDPLTGLFNRRHFDAALKRELARARRKNVPVSLVLVDIDHFKRVNDDYGHAVGDAVLRTIAQQLRLGIREGDIACRYGGEEMVLLLPECAAADAGTRAEAIRIALAAIAPHPEGEGPQKVTASFGVAAYPAHAQDAEALFWAADKALYRAKQQGRNRVVTGA